MAFFGTQGRAEHLGQYRIEPGIEIFNDLAPLGGETHLLGSTIMRVGFAADQTMLGGLRAGSSHRILLEAAQELVPEGVNLIEVPLIDVPLYNGDIEDAGDPPAVRRLKEAVAAADGVVIFTPEYNRRIPAVTKNAIDWASRTPGASAIAGKPVASMSASPGGHEVQGVRAALAIAVAGAGAEPFEESLGIANVYSLIADGRLQDPTTRTMIADYLGQFAAFVRSHSVTVDA